MTIPQVLKTLQFSGVSHRSPRGMTFDVIDLIGRPAGFVVCLTHRANLALTGRCQQSTGAVVGKPPAPNDAVDLLSCLQRIFESLQTKDSRSFTHDESLPAGIERSTATFRRESPKLGESHLSKECIRSRNSSGESLITSEGEKIFAGAGDGIECRSTSRIESPCTGSQAQGSPECRCRE